VNFGQPITDDLIEQYKPPGVDKQRDILAYRDWKKQ
jgi:hypothetical protein